MVDGWRGKRTEPRRPLDDVLQANVSHPSLPLFMTVSLQLNCTILIIEEKCLCSMSIIISEI